MSLLDVESQASRRRCAGWAGLATVTVVLGCTFTSLAMHPDYSPLTKYVSQLAFPTSPGRFVFAAGLILGGILLLPHARGLRHLTRNRYGARASWLGQVAAVAMVLVGLFPLTLPVAHFGCAFVLFAAAIFTTLFVGLGLRDDARDAENPGPLRRNGSVLIGVFVFMLVMTGWAMSYNLTQFMKAPGEKWYLIAITGVIMVLEAWMVVEFFIVMIGGGERTPTTEAPEISS